MLEGLELDCIAVNITKKRDCFEYLPVARQEYVLAVHKDQPVIPPRSRPRSIRAMSSSSARMWAWMAKICLMCSR